MTEISPEQIKNGLNALATRKETWPPNAAEFRQLCLPTSISPDGTNSGAYIAFKPEKLITDQTAIDKTEEAGKRELGNMKDLFK